MKVENDKLKDMEENLKINELVRRSINLLSPFAVLNFTLDTFFSLQLLNCINRN